MAIDVITLNAFYNRQVNGRGIEKVHNLAFKMNLVNQRSKI